MNTSDSNITLCPGPSRVPVSRHYTSTRGSAEPDKFSIHQKVGFLPEALSASQASGNCLTRQVLEACGWLRGPSQFVHTGISRIKVVPLRYRRKPYQWNSRELYSWQTRIFKRGQSASTFSLFLFFASPFAQCAYECRATSWTNDRVDLKVFITLKLTVSSQVLTLFGRWQGSTIFLESK